ncbi:MAG: hypothetical protein HY332_06170 [Chloroflexi bacterium]|nr:hypothetical protein [Chloroflexota bacterium]
MCVLCGAPAQPAHGWRRVTELGGTALGWLLNPAVLAVIGLLAALLVVAFIVQLDALAPARIAVLSSRAPNDTFALMRREPLRAAWNFLLPALIQSAILFVVVLTILFALRRRRDAPVRAKEE